MMNLSIPSSDLFAGKMNDCGNYNFRYSIS